MDRGYLVGATLHTVLYWLFWNFTGVLVMVWRYACCFEIILRLFFCCFFRKLNLAISGHIYNNVNGQGIPCGHNSSYSFIPILLKLHWCFGHDLKICMWRGDINSLNLLVKHITLWHAINTGLSHVIPTSILWFPALKSNILLEYWKR